MFIPDLLPSIDKLIYLDCDVLVNLDINELWNIDIKDKSLAGSLDVRCYQVKLSYFKRIGAKLSGRNVESYINAGVTVMNLRKIHSLGDFCSISMNWFKRNLHLPLYPDQDAINSIFFGDIKIIDAKFNIYDLSQDIHNSIIHMYRRKPWKGLNGTQSESLYWKMYLRSAWGENITRDELIDLFSSLANSSRFFHTKSSQCMKRIMKGFKYHLLSYIKRKLNLPIIMIKDAYYKLRYKLTSPKH